MLWLAGEMSIEREDSGDIFLRSAQLVLHTEVRTQRVGELGDSEARWKEEKSRPWGQGHAPPLEGRRGSLHLECCEPPMLRVVPSRPKDDGWPVFLLLIK